MSSWVLTIDQAYANHWKIAKTKKLWDLTTNRPIQAGDVVYFWLSKGSFVGRAEVSESAKDLKGNEDFPWTDHGERRYRSRIRFSRTADVGGRSVTWTEVMRNTNLPRNPSFGHRTDESQAEAWLSSLFQTVDEAEELSDNSDEGGLGYLLERLGHDNRDRTLAEISIRRGQLAFRNALLRAYGGRCVVTGSATRAVLEAAHISPYKGEHTNSLRNGLLLRSDVHTLFDLRLLTVVVERREHRVRISHEITEAFYRSLDGRQLSNLPSSEDGPASELLREHNRDCTWLRPGPSIDLRQGN